MKALENLKLLASLIVALSLTLGILMPMLSELTYAKSSRLPPGPKKNKNEVTDLFKQNIEDQASLERQLDILKTQGTDGIKSHQEREYLPDSDKLESHAVSLAKVNQSAAESEGAKIQAKESELLGSIQLDYNDPQIQSHKRDTDKIASASEELLSRLADKLKELGVDCRQKKGKEASEPEIYIKVEQESQKEIIYDKHLCEYLRKSYTCREPIRVTCSQFKQQAEPLRNITINQTEAPMERGYRERNYHYPIINRSFSAASNHENELIIRSETIARPDGSIGYGILGARGWLMTNDIRFSIDQLPNGSQFILLQASYRGLIFLAVNGTPIISVPVDANGFVNANALYPEGAEGSDAGRRAGPWFNKNLNQNLTHLVKLGENHIQVKYFVISKDGADLKFKLTKPVCTSWNEHRDEEICSLK